MNEQRKHKRFWVEPGTLAGLASSEMGSMRIAGEIVELSEAGLSLLYMTSGEKADMPSAVTIFIYKGSYIELCKVQCRLIYDVQVAGSSRWSPVSVRRCGIEFRDLSEKQLDRVRQVIARHASSEGEASYPQFKKDASRIFAVS
jgi:hypothetical protein